MLTAAVVMLLRFRIRCTGILAAGFADPVKDGTRGVNAKAVVVCDMVRDLMQMIAVEMDQRAAFGAFQVKVRMTGSGLRFLAAVLPARTAAVIERIAADKALLLKLFELPVDRCRAHRGAVFSQRMQQLCRCHMPFRMRLQIRQNDRFLLRLIAALSLHDCTPPVSLICILIIA